MENESVKEIKKYKGHFISDLGYCFRVYKGKETIIPSYILKGKPRVKLGIKTYDLLSLMVEYFIGLLPDGYRISYKVENGKIPLYNIKITKPKTTKSLSDEYLMFKYKCDIKSRNQNIRVSHEDVLTKEDVLNCLKRSDFKCIYCGEKIKSKDWHLDHVHPLCLGGKNRPNNIAAACPVCNLMKGKFQMGKFISHCYKIFKNNEDLAENILRNKFETLQ